MFSRKKKILTSFCFAALASLYIVNANDVKYEKLGDQNPRVIVGVAAQNAFPGSFGYRGNSNLQINNPGLSRHQAPVSFSSNLNPSIPNVFIENKELFPQKPAQQESDLNSDKQEMQNPLPHLKDVMRNTLSVQPLISNPLEAPQQGASQQPLPKQELPIQHSNTQVDKSHLSQPGQKPDHQPVQARPSQQLAQSHPQQQVQAHPQQPAQPLSAQPKASTRDLNQIENVISSATDTDGSFVNKLLGYYYGDNNDIQGTSSIGGGITFSDAVAFGGSTFGIIACVIAALVIGSCLVWITYSLLMCFRGKKIKSTPKNQIPSLSKQMLIDDNDDNYHKI